ncbi:ATP-binding protein [Paraburkholderia mimosarum]|uniref:ATP-binding protein n=1 Tax=Paraburkholderia mimosarum TaxID=312026 RepID=UPI0003FD1F97|nr:ATP-binding protein [Paraburkholderia mimosarum]
MGQIGIGLNIQLAVRTIFNAIVTSKPNGIGPGLSISRSIIETHGGRLSAKDYADQGVTFYFTLLVACHDDV